MMGTKVTKQFKQDFDLCMNHYTVTGEELEFEKSRVRANYAEASECYASIAYGLKRLMRLAA